MANRRYPDTATLSTVISGLLDGIPKNEEFACLILYRSELAKIVLALDHLAAAEKIKDEPDVVAAPIPMGDGWNHDQGEPVIRTYDPAPPLDAHGRMFAPEDTTTATGPLVKSMTREEIKKTFGIEIGPSLGDMRRVVERFSDDVAPAHRTPQKVGDCPNCGVRLDDPWHKKHCPIPPDADEPTPATGRGDQMLDLALRRALDGDGRLMAGLEAERDRVRMEVDGKVAEKPMGGSGRIHTSSRDRLARLFAAQVAQDEARADRMIEEAEARVEKELKDSRRRKADREAHYPHDRTAQDRVVPPPGWLAHPDCLGWIHEDGGIVCRRCERVERVGRKPPCLFWTQVHAEEKEIEEALIHHMLHPDKPQAEAKEIEDRLEAARAERLERDRAEVRSMTEAAEVAKMERPPTPRELLSGVCEAKQTWHLPLGKQERPAPPPSASGSATPSCSPRFGMPDSTPGTGATTSSTDGPAKDRSASTKSAAKER
jgi:hypothetical protein